MIVSHNFSYNIKSFLQQKKKTKIFFSIYFILYEISKFSLFPVVFN